MAFFPLFLMGAALPALGAPWECAAPNWVGAPQMVDGRFVGTLEASCSFDLEHPADMASLDRHLLESIRASREIHEGPISETFHDLPSVRYDVTVDFPSDKMTIRQDVHLATDQTTRVVYGTDSTSITASGFAGYLRKLDVEFEISKTDSPTIARFAMRTLIEVAKPWYAPTGIFFSEAKKSAFAQYDKSRGTALPDLYGHL